MRHQKRITIADVARKAGVSKQTVSRVINDKPDVAPQTRKRIQDLMKAMGYAPDPIARSMKGSTYTLGCITPNLSDFNLATIVQAAQKEAHEQGFFTLVASAASEIDFLPLLNEMINRRVDGLLIINPRDDNRYQHILPLLAEGMPTVYIKNMPGEERVTAICLDDELGGTLATQYLLSLGHTSIVTILGPENEECTQKRLAGYKSALYEAGIAVDERLILNGDWTAESGRAAITKLLRYDVRFSAIFAQNDWMAIGAMRALRENGLQIPGHISIVGYDDLPITSFIDPPLTTIRQPIEQFGGIAAKMLIDHIKLPHTQPQIIKLDPTLVIRETCTPY
ncbi:MAG: LacI family DNA-binding transcriptional regulator [Brevefilum sp.]